VGTVIVGRIGRTSIRNIASNDARAIPGLAHIRSNIASWRIVARPDGALMLDAAPVPHPEWTARTISCRRAICLTDGV
jgi:hypothetical protein